MVEVHAGDSLSTVAGRVFGTEADWPAVWYPNRKAVPDPSLIRPGQKLQLPVNFTASELSKWRTLADAAIPQPAIVAVAYQTPASPSASVPAAVPVSNGGGYEECVITHESGGDPRVVNSASGAGGLVQFLPSTWATTPWGSQYPGGAQTAPASVQLEAFQWEYARDGTAPWITDGCAS